MLYLLFRSVVRAALVAGLMSSASAFDVFVDSVNGSDTNSGATAAQAKATIAGIGSISPKMRIGLARGSHWREQLTIDPAAAPGVFVGSYGAGALPIIDCSDIAPANTWTATSGKANVYHVTWLYLGTYDDHKLRVWEDDSVLTRATSLDACSATPGTFYMVMPLSFPTTIYVHPTGSTNPASDGKKYEITKRPSAVLFAHAVRGIHTRRNGNNNGSTSLTDGGYSDLCLFEDGTNHNAIIFGGGEFKNSVFWGGEAYPDVGSSTLAVFFTNDPSGLVAKVSRCIFVGANAANTYQLAIYAHGATDTNYERMEVEDCAFLGVDNCVDATALHGTSTRNYVRSCTRLGNPGVYSFSSTDDWIDCGRDSDVMQFREVASPDFGSPQATFTIDGLRVCARSSGAAIVKGSGANMAMSVNRSVIAFRNKNAYLITAITAASGALSVNGTVFDDGAYSINIPSAGTISGNSNVFFPQVGGLINTVAYDSLESFQSATGTNANSTSANPQLVDAINGDFTIGNSSLSGLPIGLERTSIEYTPMPATVADAKAWLLAQL